MSFNIRNNSKLKYTIPAGGVGDNFLVVDPTSGEVSFRTPAQVGALGFIGTAGGVDNALLRADGTGGLTLQSSSITVSDTGAIVGVASQDLMNTVSTTLNIGGAATSVTIGATTGTLNLRNATIALTQVPATDAAFATSTVLVRDSSGNLDKLSASGGGTSNFLRADGTWASPAGGSGIGDVVGPASATDNGIARFNLTTGKLIQDSRASVSDDGDITIGTGSGGGNRQIISDGSLSNVGIFLLSKGTGSAYLSTGSGKGLKLSGSANEVELTGGDFTIKPTISGDNTYNLTITTYDAINDGYSGHLFLTTGNAPGTGPHGNVGLLTTSVSNWQAMEKGIFIANATTVPTGNPTGGGFLYVEGGAGKFRGTSGTVTTFGPADPHCPTCDSDFVHEWESDKYGYLAVCMNCMSKHLGNVPFVTRSKGSWASH